MCFACNCLLAPMLSWFIPLLLTTTSSVHYTVSSCYRYARAEQVCQDKYCQVTDFIYPASQDLRFFSIIIYTLRGTIFLSNWCRNVCDLPLTLLFWGEKNPFSQLETFCVYELPSVISFWWWKYFIVLILVTLPNVGVSLSPDSSSPQGLELSD